MSIDLKPKAFVVGWPIAHSRSPIIHGFWLKQFGIQGSYEAIAVAPPDFSDFMRDLPVNGFVGGNVTLPHKQKAFERVDRATATAAKLEAVNTLWLQDGALYGDNTDVEGFLAALDQDAPGWDAASGDAVVLGAGGAARAVVYGLLRRSRRVILANRTRERAEALATHFSAGVEVVDWARLPSSLEGAGLLVNTTSLGMKGQPPLEIELGGLPGDAVVNDIVYFPLETALIRRAQARGLRTVSGIGMLLHQAAPGFERWFGTRPGVTADLRRLVEADVLKSI
ncbi:shikimate dehydrogenase [Methylocella tundrae]|uniref:Shikimate dehydrogenase (NADP(+)) n=1 Tax=Methylocella tundrae TaxID=227605 RepID=A0A4U8Z3H1_METTU|nr:shikimate dehydrogenase [Methylocella tundrae]WPP03758.1 shikimate dehydrogenase [Methylocella tundrae]VFU09916.1 Shikimate dehydrogenase (NADP(+)) [Methylocella tundrae]